METKNYCDWNILVFYVSDVYGATKRFKAGNPAELGNKIRKTAVSLSASVNSMPVALKETDFGRIYPILSSISVLETYLQLAKKQKLLKETSVLDEKLEEVKRALYRILGHK